MSVIYPLSALRTLALQAQGLTRSQAQNTPPTPDDIYRIVEMLGCVQVDAINVVHRSHYLVVWSRLGRYNLSDFDRLVYTDPAADNQTERRLFTDWLHAASILPVSEFRYRLPLKRYLSKNPASMTKQWLSRPGSQEMLQAVLARITAEGPLHAAALSSEKTAEKTWYSDGSSAKFALDHLWACGQILMTRRLNFQPVYDLTERVLPSGVDTSEPTKEEMARHVLEHAVRSFGVCRMSQISDYIHEIHPDRAKPIIEQLIAEGVFIEILANVNARKPTQWIIHRDALATLEQAANGTIVPERTTFLCPFDNLFWPRGRDRQLWSFQSVLEAYKPAAKRKWGYYSMAILHNNQFIGRFDPKVERDTGVLRLRHLFLDPSDRTPRELVDQLAPVMRDFMEFHQARDLVVETSTPADAGAYLVSTLS